MKIENWAQFEAEYQTRIGSTTGSQHCASGLHGKAYRLPPDSNHFPTLNAKRYCCCTSVLPVERPVIVTHTGKPPTLQIEGKRGRDHHLVNFSPIRVSSKRNRVLDNGACG